MLIHCRDLASTRRITGNNKQNETVISMKPLYKDKEFKKAIYDEDFDQADKMLGEVVCPDSRLPALLGRTMWSMGRKLTVEGARWFSSKGADLSLIVKDKRRGISDTMSVAVSGSNEPLIAWLTEQPGISVDRYMGFAGSTPLIQAVTENNCESITALVKAGADVNKQTKNNKASPLHVAAANYSVEACVTLVSHMANPLLKNKMGSLPCEMVPETMIGVWNPDALYDFLDKHVDIYKKMIAPGGTKEEFDSDMDELNSGQAILDEVAVEKIGETYEDKEESEWTEMEARAARVISERFKSKGDVKQAEDMFKSRSKNTI